ncbi:HSF-type DNA-binding-domain-containing protein [Gongronella butleri]|nr:HSF-type DNA-binding-domain-containing protein [Gongronella butleri]
MKVMATHPMTMATSPNVLGALDHHQGSVPEFVKKLFRMLTDNSFPSILTWGMHGTTFVVLEPNEFSKLILPKHFKHSNFASFVRQLNKYDFHKIRHQPDARNPYGAQAWEFQHSNFQYNRRDLLYGIKRKPTKNQAKVGQHGQLIKSFKTASSSSSSMAATGVNGADMSNVSVPSSSPAEIQLLERQIKDLQSSQKQLTAQLESIAQNHHSMVSTLTAFQNAMVSQDNYVRKWLHQSLVSAEDPASHDHIQQMLYTFEQMAERAQAKLTHITTNIDRQMIPHQEPMLVPPPVIPSDGALSANQPWSIRPKVRLILLDNKDSQIVNWLQSFGCITIIDPTLQHHEPVDLIIVVSYASFGFFFFGA